MVYFFGFLVLLFCCLVYVVFEVECNSQVGMDIDYGVIFRVVAVQEKVVFYVVVVEYSYLLKLVLVFCFEYQEVVLGFDMIDNLFGLVVGNMIDQQQVVLDLGQDFEVVFDMVDVLVFEQVFDRVDQQLRLELGIFDLYVAVVQVQVGQEVIWCLGVIGQDLKMVVDNFVQGLMLGFDMVGLDVKLVFDKVDLMLVIDKDYWQVLILYFGEI